MHCPIPLCIHATLTLVVLLASAATTSAEWGAIKGQVVWGEEKIPPLVEAAVDKDQKACLAKGPIFTNTLLINKKNKGVRNVIVYLTDPKDVKNAAWTPTKIHPDLQKIGKNVEIDQPCCVFEPRIVMVRKGQGVVVKNSSTIPHNTFFANNPHGYLFPAGGTLELKAQNLVPRSIPVPFSCTIHTWMKGYLCVVAHPYFSVTDEDGKFEIKNVPAGVHHVILWQEEVGWVVYENEVRGKSLRVLRDSTVDMGSVKMTLPKD